MAKISKTIVLTNASENTLYTVSDNKILYVKKVIVSADDGSASGTTIGTPIVILADTTGSISDTNTVLRIVQASLETNVYNLSNKDEGVRFLTAVRVQCPNYSGMSAGSKVTVTIVGEER